MAHLNLFVLGQPRLEREGRPVELKLRKALALLVYLAVSGQPHSRDALATLLWPESDGRDEEVHRLCNRLRGHAGRLPTSLDTSWQVLLGIVALYRGDPIEARRSLTESMRTDLERRNTVLLERSCTYLAETALWKGKLDEAGHWLAQSLDHYADPR